MNYSDPFGTHTIKSPAFRNLGAPSRHKLMTNTASPW